MSWLRLDDGFAQHPKVADLSDREFRAWVKLLLYCARYRTGGDITPAALRELGIGKATKDAFLDVGLLDIDDGELSVHDWSSYNPSDPSNAERQARFRAKRQAKGNGTSNADRNAISNDPDRYGNGPSRVGAPARPVPSSPSTADSSSTSTEDPVPAAVELLKDLGWRDAQIDEALSVEGDLSRARAWAEHAKAHADTNPGGYALTGFRSGDWPTERTTEQEEQKMNVVDACQSFIESIAWDETFDQRAMLDEFGRIERGRRTEGALTQGDRQGLLEQWAATRQDRYGIKANLTA